MKLTKMIGTQIKNRREELGLTQDQLAELMGLNNHRSISLWENAKAPKLESIEKLSKALKCEPEYLFGFIKYPTVSTSWISQQIPLYGATIDSLRELKEECDERKDSTALNDEALMTQYLTDGVIRYLVMEQPQGANETLMTLAFRLVGALKILAEYEAVQNVGNTFAFGKEMLSAEELLELKRNPPERYRMAMWEKEMCEKNIGDLISKEITDLLKAYIQYERSDEDGNV